jgi:hypothetical protein
MASVGMRGLAAVYREAAEGSELARTCANNAERLADCLKDVGYWTCD